MKSKIYKISFLGFLIITLMSVSISTAFSNSFWNAWLKPFGTKGDNIETVIITGNYLKSRLLAELIQNYNSQPIILTPAVGDKIFFLPPKKHGVALQITYNEYPKFVNFLNAKYIIVLGDSNYVPNKYIDILASSQVICRITSNDWKKIAYSAGKLLNLSNLYSRYVELEKAMLERIKLEKSKIQPESITENKNVVTDSSTLDTTNIKEIDASQK